eukprot:1060327_1
MQVQLQGLCPTEGFYCPTAESPCAGGHYCPKLHIDTQNCTYTSGCKFNGGDTVYFAVTIPENDLAAYVSTTLDDMALCGDYDASITSCIKEGDTLDYFEMVVKDTVKKADASYLDFDHNVLNGNKINGSFVIPKSIRIATIYLEIVITVDVNLSESPPIVNEVNNTMNSN